VNAEAPFGCTWSDYSIKMIHMFGGRRSSGLKSPPWRSFQRLDAAQFPRNPPPGSVLARKNSPADS
jgi:hypothetical protein